APSCPAKAHPVITQSKFALHPYFLLKNNQSTREDIHFVSGGNHIQNLLNMSTHQRLQKKALNPDADK
ncbi:MAG: hypothetical protein ACUVQ4_09610, partial [bacterium]